MPATYDGIADNYDATFADNISQAEDRFVTKRYKTLVATVVADGGFIVDVGCGTGWLLDHWRVPPENYLGFDVSRQMTEIAKKKHPFYPFAVSDMKESWQPYCYNADLICSLWCVGNYDTPERHLVSIAKALAPRGKAILTVHAEGFHKDQRRKKGAVLPSQCYKDDGWRAWNADQVIQIAETLGLTVKVAPFRHFKHLPHWLPTTVHSLWLKLRKPTPENALYLAIELEKP